ncbi:unnamed protein product [Peronospora belbahrii]|uniref:Uncharacterized protein n=1 Tax=Peronospora belbahrii TaxID=622444 RepID=A0AAU9L0Q1_9STRA|nr:unnamed protein product [Peronospora belbahrii]
MESPSGDEKLLNVCVTKSIETTQSLHSDNTTWNFVQMNMTLLPIACPLPVSISCRVQEGAALVGIKPSTPTQKLHHRLRQHTTNISPRRHDQDCNNVRPLAITSSHQRHVSRGLPPTPRSASGSKRKLSETWHVPATDTSITPLAGSVSTRMRSYSEKLFTPALRRDSKYASDLVSQMPSGCSLLDQNARRFSGCAAKGLYKGKRILELQDEDRRFYPDDRGTALLPSKRSKHQL